MDGMLVWRRQRGRRAAARERRHARVLTSVSGGMLDALRSATRGWLALALLFGLLSGAWAGDAAAARARKKTATRPAATASSRPAAPKRASILTAIRFWTGKESTRLAFETSTPVTYAAAVDSSRGVIKVTLRDAMPAPAVPALREIKDGAVRTVQVAEVPDGVEVTVRVEQAAGVPPLSSERGEDGIARLFLDVPRPGKAAREQAEARVARELSRAPARVVVIDPGHGGEAPGAVGPKRLLEKDVCLAIARKLANQLEKDPGVRAFLTRDGDYNVPLRDRYHHAERLQADVFVSIHANSGRKRNGRGTEVYFLSLASASDEQAKLLADAENAADMVGGVPPSEEELVSILVDLKQNEVIHQSAMLAEAVLDRITGVRQLENRGVKQAPFAVLKSPLVPSILVETAFINNPAEAKLLRDVSFQDEMAEQISQGILGYLETAPMVARDTSGTVGAQTEASSSPGASGRK